MAPNNYPSNYLLNNAASSKKLMVVVQIEGVPDLIATGDIYTKIRYGDPGIHYGDPGIVYGGLRKRGDFKPYLSITGSMTISQKIEPEQGRGAISLLTLNFIDKDGYFTNLITPGKVVDEPLGNKLVKVYLGYQNTSFPEDYFVVLRGYISQTIYKPSLVSIQLSDPNIKRKADIFFTPQTALTAPIDASTLSIPVAKSDGFYQPILGPDGSYDSSVKTYIQIDDEVMEYGPTGLGGTTITVLSRGSRDTVADAHDINTSVSNTMQLSGNLIDLALKLNLSGWNGDFISGVGCRSIVNTLDPTLGDISNAIVLPEDVDAVEDLGLYPGDYVTISGSSAGNDGTYKITSINPVLSRDNRLLLVDSTLNYESPATGVSLSFRSQYDTLPLACGMKLSPVEVDVAGHVQTRNDFFAQSENDMQFYITDKISGKTFIESELFLPVGAYSITRYGQVAVAVTKPPIADQKLIILNQDNIKDMAETTIVRGINNRRYFDEAQYQWDAYDNGDFANTESFINTEALSKISVSSPLPIASKGLRTVLGALTVITRRANYILTRYAKAAIELTLKTDWETISQLEVGDVVAVEDNGQLKLANLSDGTRNLQTQLFEVINRALNLSTGDGSLTLLGGIGFEVTDRFGTISPSSKADSTGNSPTSVKIIGSFGELYTGQEYKKWIDGIGLPIVVHSADYTTRYGESVLVGFDPADPFRLLLNPALSFTPQPGDIVEIGDYPNNTDPNDSRFYKLVYCHIDPSVPVSSGTDYTHFFVSVPDAAKFTVGLPVLIHNDDWSIISPESKVLAIDTGTGEITVETPLGFTPASGQTVEFIGFIDFGGPYRIL